MDLTPILDETQNATPNEDQVILRRSHLYAVLLPLAFVAGLAAGYLFWGGELSSQAVSSERSSSQQVARTTGVDPEVNAGSEQSSSASQQQSSNTGSQPEISRYEIPLDDDPRLGPDDAPITIVEFSDFECPFCQRWHVEVFGRLLAAYPDQIRFVYRDFPLTSIHDNATSAAQAANCAGEQDAYWAYHDKLFRVERGLGRPAYMQYAQELNLDITAFETCVDSNRYEEEIQADFEFAAQLGVRSTPTFFINGLAVVGAQPFEVFQQVIERELAGEIP